MAHEGTYQNHARSLLEKINAELTCGVCLELYTSPVMLPCSHNFCQQCINGMIDRQLSVSDIQYGPPTSFNCPLCNLVVRANKYQFNKWPINRTLESIVALSKTSVPSGIFDSSWYYDLEPTIGKCESHGQSLDKFCDSCTEVICGMCEKSQHSSQRAKHRVEPVKQAVRSYQTDITNCLSDLKRKMMPLDEQIKRLELLLKDIQVNADHNKKQADEKFSELMKLLRCKQSDILHKMETEVKRQTEPITEDLDLCHSVQNNVQDVMSKLSHFRRIKNPTLLLQLMKNAHKQLDSLVSLDVDHCLRSLSQHSPACCTYDLHTQNVIGAIENLCWEDDGGTEKPSLGSLRNVSVQTMESDVVAETLNQDQDNHEDNKDNNGTTGKSSQAMGSKTSIDSATSVEFSNEKSFDEPDGDLPLSKPDIVTDHPANATDNPIGSQNRNKINDKERDKKSDLECKDIDKQALSEKFDGLDLGENNTMAKGRRSFPMDMKSPTVSEEVKVLKVLSARKDKYSTSDRSNAAALKSFVARRRTMSPSVSSTSLESMSRSLSGEKLSLRPDAARRNASSPALKSLESYYVENDENMNRTLSRDKKKPATSFEASGVSEVLVNMNVTASAGAVKETEATSESNWSNSSAVRTTHSSKQKSFTTQPIGLNLDLNLDVEEQQACKRVTNV